VTDGLQFLIRHYFICYQSTPSLWILSAGTIFIISRVGPGTEKESSDNTHSRVVNNDKLFADPQTW